MHDRFRDRIAAGGTALGTCVTFADATVSEALGQSLDFVWIDMEHNPLSLAAVQSHVMAAQLAGATPLVRVAWNDPVLVKPVLDLGAAGVIVPLIRTVDDARRAVAACRYPPDGVRGFGPRRPSRYGRDGGPEFCRAANDGVLTIVQIEHIDAVEAIDEILAVPGLGAVVVGSNDLSGSLGLMGQPRHPDVLRAAQRVLDRARHAGIPGGMAVGDDPDILAEWIDRGARWLSMGSDFSLLLRGLGPVAGRLREHRPAK